jgi:hypothetical protein
VPGVILVVGFLACCFGSHGGGGCSVPSYGTGLVNMVESFIDENATMSATDDETAISTDNVVEESDDNYDDNDYVDDNDDNDSNYQNHPQIVQRPLHVNRQSSRDGVYDNWPKSECFRVCRDGTTDIITFKKIAHENISREIFPTVMSAAKDAIYKLNWI